MQTLIWLTSSIGPASLRKAYLHPSRPKPTSSLPFGRLFILPLSEDVENEDSIEERGSALRAD